MTGGSDVCSSDLQFVCLFHFSLMECWNNDLLNDENEEEETQENKVRMALCRIACKSILIYYEKYICKEPCRTSRRIGNIFTQEILHGNETQCYENFRLRKSVFLDLSKDLTDKYGLKPTRGMSVYEELGMFLMICAHGTGNRMVQEIFQHSGETIHRHFHSVLKAIGKLARDIIQPHPSYNDGVGDHKPCNQQYLPFFKVSDILNNYIIIFLHLNSKNYLV